MGKHIFLCIMEVWKNINSYYRVSNLGNVESCKMGYWKSMNKTKMPKGYLCVNLSENNKATKKYIHRLVAIYFISNPLLKSTVNHKNGIKYDNRVENLEWATQSENNKHSYEIGIKKPTNQLGNKNGNARLTNLQVSEIRSLWDKGNITKLKLASIFNVSDAHICRIINKQQRTDIL